jgi:hypothetical protein
MQACIHCQWPIYTHGFNKKSFICTVKSHITFFPKRIVRVPTVNSQACFFIVSPYLFFRIVDCYDHNKNRTVQVTY